MNFLICVVNISVCAELFVIAVNILLVIRYCCANILVCAVSYLLLL